jgi:hypothetical protein
MLDVGVGWSQSLLNDSVSLKLFHHTKLSPSSRDKQRRSAHFNCLFRDVPERSKERNYRCVFTRTAMTLLVLQKWKVRPSVTRVFQLKIYWL